MLRSFVRKLLRTGGLDHRYHDLQVYHEYLRFRYPKTFANIEAEKMFYAELFLGAGSDLVFDIGANQGSKATIFVRLAKRVVCLEPDSRSVYRLRLRFAKEPRVIVEEAGVGSAPGLLPFHIVEPGSCYNSFSAKSAEKLGVGTPDQSKQTVVEHVNITTIDNLISKYGLPNYVKIDAEGFELEILRGLSYKVPLLSFESNLPEFREETLACIQRIMELSSSAHFNYFTCHDHPIMLAPQWLSGEAMLEHVAITREPFMEVFARCE